MHVTELFEIHNLHNSNVRMEALSSRDSSTSYYTVRSQIHKVFDETLIDRGPCMRRLTKLSSISR